MYIFSCTASRDSPFWRGSRIVFLRFSRGKLVTGAQRWYFSELSEPFQYKRFMGSWWTFVKLPFGVISILIIQPDHRFARHDSSVVVIYAKLWPDLISKFCVRTNHIHTIFQPRAYVSLAQFKFKFKIVYCLWLHIGNTAIEQFTIKPTQYQSR